MTSFDPLALLMERWDEKARGMDWYDEAVQRATVETSYKAALRHLAEAGIRLVPPSSVEVVEIARKITDPDPAWPDGDEAFPYWGEPDLTYPAPSINGHPCHWVTRTVTYGPWEPVTSEDGR